MGYGDWNDIREMGESRKNPGIPDSEHLFRRRGIWTRDHNIGNLWSSEDELITATNDYNKRGTKIKKKTVLPVFSDVNTE